MVCLKHNKCWSFLRPMFSQFPKMPHFRYHFQENYNRCMETTYPVWRIDVLTITLARCPVWNISEIYMYRMHLTPSIPKIALFSVHILAKLRIGYQYKSLLLIVRSLDIDAGLVWLLVIHSNYDNIACVKSHCQIFHEYCTHIDTISWKAITPTWLIMLVHAFSFHIGHYNFSTS